MRTLIVYFSFTGNNAIVAKDFASDLNASVVRITEPRRRTGAKIILDMLFNRTPRIDSLKIDWSAYDHTVLIAPIWNYRIAHPLKTFLRNEKGFLGSYSFVTLCIGREHQVEKIITQLNKQVGYPPKAVLEMKINDLIPAQMQNKVKHVSNYKITEEDLTAFAEKKSQFLEAIRSHT